MREGWKMEEKMQESQKSGLSRLGQVKGVKSRAIIMSEVYYRRIIWTLALSSMAIGFFSMWGVNVLIHAYGLASEHQTPVWLAWVLFLGLPLAGRVILSQSLKGR
jgi:hypothetical protein